MKRIYLGKTRKVRSISIDSDVIIDIPSLKILLDKTRLNKEERKYVERCEFSFQLLSLAFAVRVNVIGTEVIRKELSFSPVLKNLYEKIFDKTVSLLPKTKDLAKDYENKINIKPADSLILASVSIGKIDCFLSWNREHIVNPLTIKMLKEVNKDKELPIPLIITPEGFLSRIVLSQDQTICFFRDPIPQRFRLQFYPSKRLL